MRKAGNRIDGGAVVPASEPLWTIEDMEQITPLSPQAVALAAMFDQIPESATDIRNRVFLKLSRLIQGGGASKQASDSLQNDHKKQ